jgi:hypothetical protein
LGAGGMSLGDALLTILLAVAFLLIMMKVWR